MNMLQIGYIAILFFVLLQIYLRLGIANPFFGLEAMLEGAILRLNGKDLTNKTSEMEIIHKKNFIHNDPQSWSCSVCYDSTKLTIRNENREISLNTAINLEMKILFEKLNMLSTPSDIDFQNGTQINLRRAELEKALVKNRQEAFRQKLKQSSIISKLTEELNSTVIEYYKLQNVSINNNNKKHNEKELLSLNSTIEKLRNRIKLKNNILIIANQKVAEIESAIIEFEKTINLNINKYNLNSTSLNCNNNNKTSNITTTLANLYKFKLKNITSCVENRVFEIQKTLTSYEIKLNNVVKEYFSLENFKKKVKNVFNGLPFYFYLLMVFVLVKVLEFILTGLIFYSLFIYLFV
jgi:hypothetical protein